MYTVSSNHNIIIASVATLNPLEVMSSWSSVICRNVKEDLWFCIFDMYYQRGETNLGVEDKRNGTVIHLGFICNFFFQALLSHPLIDPIFTFQNNWRG